MDSNCSSNYSWNGFSIIYTVLWCRYLYCWWRFNSHRLNICSWCWNRHHGKQRDRDECHQPDGKPDDRGQCGSWSTLITVSAGKCLAARTMLMPPVQLPRIYTACTRSMCRDRNDLHSSSQSHSLLIRRSGVKLPGTVSGLVSVICCIRIWYLLLCLKDLLRKSVDFALLINSFLRYHPDTLVMIHRMHGESEWHHPSDPSHLF